MRKDGKTKPTMYRFRDRLPEAGEGKAPRAEVTAAVDGDVATIRLYDVIDSWGGYWGISAKEFADTLDTVDSAVTEIRLHINSPGGEVFEAVAILNQLRAHKARIVAVVDGLAASAASFIAAGADELIMLDNSQLMIHDAWGLCVGNAADMRATGDLLDHLSDNIASIYAAKSGTDVEVWRTAMLAETWYSAAEAVEAGLADKAGDAEDEPEAEDVPVEKDDEDDPLEAFDALIATFKASSPAKPAEPTSPAADYRARHRARAHRMREIAVTS